MLMQRDTPPANRFGFDMVQGRCGDFAFRHNVSSFPLHSKCVQRGALDAIYVLY